MSDLIKREDAIKAIANLHVSHDREEIFKAYAKNPHSMTTEFEGTLIDAINAVNAIPSADRPQGYWAMRDKCEFRCSNCGKIIYADCESERAYCPNCGSKNRINSLLKWDDMPLKGADDE